MKLKLAYKCSCSSRINIDLKYGIEEVIKPSSKYYFILLQDEFHVANLLW